MGYLILNLFFSELQSRWKRIGLVVWRLNIEANNCNNFLVFLIHKLKLQQKLDKALFSDINFETKVQDNIF